MENDTFIHFANHQIVDRQLYTISNENNYSKGVDNDLPEILFITSFPPRECGIATYSQDLKKALNNKFNNSFKISICPLESETEKHVYTEDVKYILNTDTPFAFTSLAENINQDENIFIVLIQHEFGLFKNNKSDLQQFMQLLTKPVVIVFHTVLPNPDENLLDNVRKLSKLATSIIVMTQTSAKVLQYQYQIFPDKITVIQHGTHLVPHLDKEFLKSKYQLSGKKILSTFGLLSSGKSIESTLDVLPAIVAQHPEVVFLIIGKTHPSVIKHEGELYRNMLQMKIVHLKLEKNVVFINEFLPLNILLEYLQLTDIYLFTSKDPHQAVSGTFSYAISCGCAIVSTPIPHALEVLENNAGIIVDFGNVHQLEVAVNKLLFDENLRKIVGINGLHQIAPTSWENTAIAHAQLFEKLAHNQFKLHYTIPPINLNHVKRMTTDFGMYQFAIINQPDADSGYTLDDNARALVALCQHFELTKDDMDIEYIYIYFDFIKYCLLNDGNFLNYINEKRSFTEQNNETNLEDSNGRAIWALGFLISMRNILPNDIIEDAEITLQKATWNVNNIHSTRAMAFIIKGLYYANIENSNSEYKFIIKKLADRLVQMYKHEADKNWDWYEGYLTYANSILPEAMLCAWLATDEYVYKEIALSTFDFLLSKIFRGDKINVISNQGWRHRGNENNAVTVGGEQPIDVAYTILALNKFYEVFKDEEYMTKMEIAFNWFLGNNHLHQIVYNPCTGGCFDGLEFNHVNLNQGAESTVSYLMARLTIEKSFHNQQIITPLATRIKSQHLWTRIEQEEWV